MTLNAFVAKCLLAASMLAVGVMPNHAAQAQKDKTQEPLPAGLEKAKIYQLPEETQPGEATENPVVYKSMGYEDINFEHLGLNLTLSVKPVDRAATIHKIYFQDVRANGIPVHIETFEKEFKLSKKDTVDMPAPLKCTIVFSELESLKPVKDIVEKDSVKITGKTFIEVRLNTLEKVALRSKQLVIPVTLAEDVPLNLFSGNPILQMAASRVLETLSDPTSLAAINLGREHVAKVAEDHALDAIGRASLYLLYCEYALRDPKTQASEKFNQSGTGFLVSADGKLLTAKRVIQPWKFDAAIAAMMARSGLEVDPKGYRVLAWPAGAQALTPQGAPNTAAALSTDNQTLKVLKTSLDQMEKQDYQDPDSGERTSISLHLGGAADFALLQLTGANFQPLAFITADSPAPQKTGLFGFPFGSNQAQATPQFNVVNGSPAGELINLDRQLNPGESGAPLMTPEGKVLAMATGGNECTPIEAARTLIQ